MHFICNVKFGYVTVFNFTAHFNFHCHSCVIVCHWLRNATDLIPSTVAASTPVFHYLIVTYSLASQLADNVTPSLQAKYVITQDYRMTRQPLSVS